MTAAEDIKKQLIASLGMEAPARDVPEEPETVENSFKPKRTTPYAVKVDEWSIERGERALEDDDNVVNKALLGRDDSESECIDFMAAAFEYEPELNDEAICQNPKRHKYLQTLMESEQYQDLHYETAGDLNASELAAGSFAQSWVQLCQQQEEEQDGPTGPGEGDGEDGDKEGKGGGAGGLLPDLDTLRKAHEALQNAQEEVDDLRDAEEAFGGLGLGDGADGKADMNRIRETFKRIKNSQTIRSIVRRAGAYRMAARSKQKRLFKHGIDEIVDVELDDELDRAFPDELAQLCSGDELMEDLALQRLLESKMLCERLHAPEAVGRGPIVVVCDESGSMMGEPNEMSKAFALSMGWIARYQKRFICFVSFSGGNNGEYLAMPPNQWDDSALMDWIEHFYGGGTSVQVPLVELPRKWEELGCPKGKTDVICITDGVLNVPDEIRESYLAWKAENNVKLYSIMLDAHGYFNGGDKSRNHMELISERCWYVKDLGVKQEAIQALMGISAT